MKIHFHTNTPFIFSYSMRVTIEKQIQNEFSSTFFVFLFAIKKILKIFSWFSEMVPQATFSEYFRDLNNQLQILNFLTWILLQNISFRPRNLTRHSSTYEVQIFHSLQNLCYQTPTDTSWLRVRQNKNSPNYLFMSELILGHILKCKDDKYGW